MTHASSTVMAEAQGILSREHQLSAPNALKVLAKLLLALNPLARGGWRGALLPAANLRPRSCRHALLAPQGSTREELLGPYTAWLLANGARMDGVEVAWISDSMGAGLIATRDLPADAVVCQVPRALLFSAMSGRDDADLGQILELVEDELDEDDGQCEGLAVLQLLFAAASVQRGESSHFAPYIQMLPTHVNTPVIWPRKVRDALLAGTTFLGDVREIRVSMCLEYRRVRSKLRQSGHAEWLELLGLTSGLCPLSGQDIPAVERWLLARSLVRSRAYKIPEDFDDFAEVQSEEMVMAPLLDLANHDDELDTGFCWGDGLDAPEDSVIICTEHEVRAGSPVHISYGSHSRCASIISFGFSTEMQRSTFVLRQFLDPEDPYGAEKMAVLQAAGILRRDGCAFFELPPDPPEVCDDVLHVFRLLALPPAYASRLLGGAGEMTEEQLDGVWEALEGPMEDMNIERAAYAKLLRTCRQKLFRLRATRVASEVEVTPDTANVAAVVREAELQGLGLFLALLASEAKELPRQAK